MGRSQNRAPIRRKRLRLETCGYAESPRCCSSRADVSEEEATIACAFTPDMPKELVDDAISPHVA